MVQRAVQESKTTIHVGGAGDLCKQLNHEIYLVKLPMHNGENVTMSRVCLELNTFPSYLLQSVIE